MTREEIGQSILDGMGKAWDKMGDVGNYDYTTHKMNYNEENYWFGYFRALEDLLYKLDQSPDKIKLPLDVEI